MLIIGDDRLNSNFKLCKIESFDEISKLSSIDVVFFDNLYEKIELSNLLTQNSISFAVLCKTIKEALYANIQRANFIIVEKELAKSVQKLAENYMFDAKVLQLIETQDELEEVAMNCIDGVIYRSCLDGNS